MADMQDRYTFKLTVPEQMMHEVIGWTDRQNLGALPAPIALFIAHVGNTTNWTRDVRAV